MNITPLFKNLLKEAWPIIEKSAPAIASSLSIPYVGTAMAAINVLTKAFGIDNFDLPALSKAIVDDPDCEGKLCELENNYGEVLKNILSNHFPSEAEINIKLKWPQPISLQ